MNSKMKRVFIDLDEGQVHVRFFDYLVNNNSNNPLVMFHGSPGSSKMLYRLANQIAKNRIVICPDTMGQGDSSIPIDRDEDIDMNFFADISIKTIKKLGYSEVDLFGHHTGARIAIEFAIKEPQLVNKIILDGMNAKKSEERLEYAKTVDKSMLIDQAGRQFHSVWNTLRDGYLFWPYNKTFSDNVRQVGLPSAEHFNEHFIEILKGVRSSHLAYKAALTYNAPARLPLVSNHTLATCAEYDVPWENGDSIEQVKNLMQNCLAKPHPQKMPESRCTSHERLELIKMYEEFLEN
ncbi:alpha/beta hydrolase [Alphaproteobacteria bacterium]|nr:alpha/beta hydrolase [Alphaproteobacteria bacterium]|tara:strand:+ start:77 stop:955 length:879 start_codon:yes stop_codon:yes gene_type:complete